MRALYFREDRVYLSIIIGVLVLVGLGVFGISLLLFKLNSYVGYAAGLLACLTGVCLLVSFSFFPSVWFSSQGGPGEVIGGALVMLASGAVIAGSLVFWGYVIYRASRTKI